MSSPAAATSAPDERAEGRPAGLARALGRFVLVPRGHASYVTDAASAARSLRLDRDEIAALADLGLPHVTDPRRGPLFDYVDLVNVAMFCGTGQSVPELALRFLLRFAASPQQSWFEPREWLVGVRLPELPGSAPARPPVRVRVADLTADGVTAVPSAAGLGPPPGELLGSGYQAVIRLAGQRQAIARPEVLALWAEVVAALVSGQVIYQTVPESLRALPAQAWQLRMADCIVVSRLMAGRIRELGLPARARRGYLLGLVGSDHAWCEVLEEGHWKQLDAVFAFAASGGGTERNFGMDAPDFAAACCGSRFNRLLPCAGDDAAPLVYFGDRPAPPWALAGVSARPWRPS
jgi:hypothetical protein